MRRPRRDFLGGAALLGLGGLALCLCAGGARGEPSSEYQVKAAFLLNFTKYVEWPDGAFANESSPFVVGIVGKDPFGGTLDKTFDGKSVNGHGFVLKRFRQAADVRDCHMLFISESEKERVGRILAREGNSPTLTVSDVDQFTRSGGMIGFVLEDERVRFEINTEAAQRAGLKISSRLLTLAKAVRS